MLGDWLGRMTERALAPYSAAAFMFAIGCVAVATFIRYALGWIDADIVPFAAHFPAVMIVAMFAGTPAAILAVLLSIATVSLLFMTGRSELEWLNSAIFALSCIIIIVVAEAYRQMVARYRDQERVKNLMLRELEHRGKNMRSVVESIVAQTLPDNPELATTVIGRIRAVSSINDLISQTESLEADLAALIRAKFEPFGPLRASLDGESVTLSANAARNLSLVFHELVTNAIKYGALSDEKGRVEIAWRLAGDMLTIDWIERGGPSITPPAQRGFGTRLVVGCVKNLRGTINADFPPSGLVCAIAFPYKKAPA